MDVKSYALYGGAIHIVQPYFRLPVAVAHFLRFFLRSLWILIPNIITEHIVVITLVITRGMLGGRQQSVDHKEHAAQTEHYKCRQRDTVCIAGSHGSDCLWHVAENHAHTGYIAENFVYIHCRKFSISERRRVESSTRRLLLVCNCFSYRLAAITWLLRGCRCLHGSTILLRTFHRYPVLQPRCGLQISCTCLRVRSLQPRHASWRERC